MCVPAESNVPDSSTYKYPTPTLWEINPLVRCKDCVHYEDGMCMYPDNNGDYLRLAKKPNGYCDWAAKKR